MIASKSPFIRDIRLRVTEARKKYGWLLAGLDAEFSRKAVQEQGALLRIELRKKG